MIGLYARVSTQEQAKEGYSIDEQIDRLKKYCEAHGRYDYKLYVDAGYSGATTNRPDLKKIIKDVKNGELDKIIVYKLDRLSRSQKDTLFLIEDVFLKYGANFESMNERFDTGTSFGRAIIGILAVFAQLEREQIKERMALGMEGRAKDGKWHGGLRTPIGYDYKDGQLVVNEYEAMQVRECFRMLLDGLTYSEIAFNLNKKGYKQNGNIWYYNRVRCTVSNVIYLGMIKYKSGEYQGTHEPLISADVFEKAQKIVANRYEAFKRGSYKATHSLLSGLIYCAECGARYFMSKSKQYHYYTCYSRRKIRSDYVKNINCKNKIYREADLDKIVLDEIRKLKTDPDYIFKIQEANSPEGSEMVSLLLEEVKKLEAQRKRFMALYGLGDFSAEDLQEQIRPLNEQREQLLAEIDSISTPDADLDAKEAISIIDNFSDALDAGTFEQRRLLVESLIDHIDINGEEISIHWKFA